MSYDLVKVARRQRLINALRASEDFQKHAGIGDWFSRRWDDVKSGAGKAWDFTKFVAKDAWENPGITALGLLGTAAGVGAPIYAARLARLGNNYRKYKKYDNAAKKADTFKKQQKARDLANQAQAKLRPGTPKPLQARFKDPVKLPGVKPINNPVAKVVASPYRAMRGLTGAATHPTMHMPIGRSPAGAGLFRRWVGQPLINTGAAGLTYLEGKNLYNMATKPKDWSNNMLYPVGAYNRWKNTPGPHSGKFQPPPSGGQQPGKPPKNYTPAPPKPTISTPARSTRPAVDYGRRDPNIAQ